MFASLVDLYLTSLQAEGVTPATLRWHRSCLKKFNGYLVNRGESEKPDDWTALLFRSYIVHLQTSGNRNGAPHAPHAVQSYVRSLRAFCQWLTDEEFVSANPMRKVKQPKAPALVKPTVNKDELAQLFEAAKAGRTGFRDIALLLFMLDTGARASEVCSLKTSEIAWEPRFAKVLGKGQKERFIPFTAITSRAMQKYSIKSRNMDCEYFFQSEEGQKLSASGLFQLCRRLGDRAGVHLNPHKLRHTFCTESLRQGASVFTVQRIMGHSTLDMTMRYAALVSADLAADHARHSPVASLVSRKN